jgi:hypothetical protein
MEYLMTYGWAILIIAVVLGALFSLGVFNANNFAPKASSGACQVFRPNGPGTTMDINLAGECQGLEPQYVAQFNGQTSIATTGYGDLPSSSNARSAFGWVNWGNTIASSGLSVIEGYGECSIYGMSGIGVKSGGSLTFVVGGTNPQSGLVLMPNKWTFFGYTYNSAATTVTMYMNSQSNTIALTGVLNTQFSSAPIPSAIGGIATTSAGSGCSGTDFNGLIADVQIYNTSLTQNQIQALYQEGIGGAPIDLQNIVGWWPLNGNANDYSGNNNNGQATSVTYTSSWTSGYSAP